MFKKNYLFVVLAIFSFASNFQNIFVAAFLSVSKSRSSTRLWNAPPELNEWKLLSSGSIVGTVTGHPAINNGDVITTSPIDNPDAASRQSLVQTASGTTYKLLEPMPDAPAHYLSNADNPLLTSDAFREAVSRFELNMRTVGINQQYYLAGQPTPSTSGKSNIWVAYRVDMDGVPIEPPLCVKVSKNIEAVSREFENYQRINFPGIAQGCFVQCIDYLPVAGYEDIFRNQCALVLERGARDLKSFLDSRGRLEGSELRDACLSAANCVQAIHSAGLVWTDIKTENFVVMPDGNVKGIDLESAMPQGGNPVDYSPEACPPEFAKSFLEGDARFFTLHYSYDIWSLGMLFLELATGRGVFDNKTPAETTKLLKDLDEIPLNNMEGCGDDNLRDLIQNCLQKNDRSRPSMAQVMKHPYFVNIPKPNAHYFMN